MADVPAHIAKEAKSLQQDLKELLKKNDLFDKEIDIKRKNLRRQYLRLLFLHPYARESKDAETHLWMQTSYSLISIYKQRIAALDRAIHNPSRQSQQQHSSHSNRTVEYRKLLQRFRQFLAEEEKFWMQLVLRFRRYFALDEAQPMLNVLGILPEDDQAPAVESATSVTSPRRNQHQFPPECDAVGSSAPVPTSPTQRESRTAILSKALVCLGDIARYKEQYNESGGRPRAGHEDGPPAVSSARGGRGRRGGAGGPNHTPLPRLRNYDRAQTCYEQARLLLPHDGNPSHQLGILSSYQKDTLSSIAHYYRALCVRTPYETASENLGSALHRALDTYKSRGLLKEQEKEEDIAAHGAVTPRVRVEAFKEKVVVLHALWYANDDEASAMGERVLQEFSGLVADRILPIEMISKVVVLVQGALWKFRMIRRPSHGEKRSSRPPSTESQIVTHLIATHRVLLKNGTIELAEAPPEDAAVDDLAQRITATFRRTLPALRMAGKWLRSNTRYLSQGLKPPVPEEQSAKDATKSKDRRHGAVPVAIGGIVEFWNEYARFSDALVRAFPVDALPPLRAQLEEDVEMAGFLPLRKYMVGSDGNQAGSARPSSSPAKVNEGSTQSQDGSQSSRDQVHPNEEQLMRISDILADAKAIVEDEYTPVEIDSGRFIVKDLVPIALRGDSRLDAADTNRTEATPPAPQHPPPSSISVPQTTPAPHAPEYVPHSGDVDEDNVSVTTRTDDDPVRDAFQTALDGGEDDEEEERIVWQPSAPLSPREDPIVTSLPKTPDRPSPIGTHLGRTPRRNDPLSPLFKQPEIEKSPPLTAQHGTPLTTAQDLLQNVLGVRSPPVPHHARGASGPVNLFLGSGGSSNSIWSTAGEAPSLHYPANGLGNGSQYSSPPAPPPLPPSQTSWATSSPWQSPPTSQHAQLQYSNGVPPRPYIPQQSSLVNSGHYRAPSESVMLSRPHGLGPSVQAATQRYDALNGAGSPNLRSYGIPITNPVDLLPPATLSGPFSPPNARTYYRQDLDPLAVHPPPSHPSLDRTFQAPYAPPSVSSIWGNPG